MARLLRSLLAVSFALLAACASRPPGDPPGLASGIGRFVTTVLPSGGYTDTHPFLAGYDFRMQALYAPADVRASGRITALRFVRAADTATVSCPAVSIRLGHTSMGVLGVTFASNVDASTLTTVASGATISIPPGAAGTWFEVPLATPFDYDGVENLVVDLETPAACSGTIAIGTLNAPNRRVLSLAADTSPATSEHSTTTGTVDGAPPGLGLVFAGGVERFTYDGSGSPNAFPLSDRAGGVRWQNLHLASDLAGSGPITGVGFEADATTTTTFVYSMRIGHTTATTVAPGLAGPSTLSFDSFSQDWVTVATSVTFTIHGGFPAGTWIWLPMPDGTFNYNGRDNLVLEVWTFSGTVALPLRASSRVTGRHFAHTTFPEPGYADSISTHTQFRFAGAPVTITPGFNSPGSGASAQPVGGWSPAGQILGLYDQSVLGTRGAVTKLALRLRSIVPTTVPRLDIYMGTTLRPELAVTDPYASSLDGATLVYSGPLTIPAGLHSGDWIDIPLQNAFRYDAAKSLTIFFSSDVAPSTGNTVAAVMDASAWTAHSVGGNVKPAPVTTVPSWNYNGSVAVKLTLE